MSNSASDNRETAATAEPMVRDPNEPTELTCELSADRPRRWGAAVRSTLRSALAGSPRGQLGAALLLLLALLALAGPLLTGDPLECVDVPLSAPSGQHLLGTTGQGQDVLAQLAAGTRHSLLAGLLVGLLVVAVGAVVGVTAGYVGGRLDTALSLAINVLLVVPSLPLAIVLAAWLPPGPLTVGAVLVATGWAWNARVLRLQSLALRQRDFVLAARLSGEHPARVVLVELLPNLAPLLLSQWVGAITYAIGAQVGLEFLGLGDVGSVSWGSCLYWAGNDQALLTGAWWTFVPTGGCIALVGFALTLLQEVADAAVNPSVRAEQQWRRWLQRVGGSDVATRQATPVVRS